MKKLNDKLSKGKIQLLLSDAFFASLMMNLKVDTSPDVEKVMTDGEVLLFNPDYVETLTIDEIKATICSAVLKVANFHHLRQGAKDFEYWNRASEIVTNQIVKDAGMKLPKDALIDDSFAGKAIEQVYTALYGNRPDNKGQQGNDGNNKPGKGKKQQQQQGNDGQGQGNGQNDPQSQPQPQPSPVNVQVKQSPTAKTQSEKSQKEADIKQQIAQAAMIGRKAGNTPGNVTELINDLLNPRVNWHETLARFISDLAKNDYSYFRPNPSLIHTGLYFPILRNIEVGKIAFFIDVSISVDLPLCKQFISEAQHAATDINAPLLVLFIDTIVRGEPIEIQPGEFTEVEIPRGGGTDFRPGFNYLKENDIDVKAIIYLTDGECHRFADEPEVPVLWVKYGNYHFEPPYGEVLEIKNDEEY